MIPDPEMMIKAAEKIEDTAHGNGWDEPPVLGIVLAQPLGIMVAPMPVQPADMAVGGDCVGALSDLATSMEGHAYEATTGVDLDVVGTTIAGVWFVSEGWQAPPGTTRAEQRPFADIVGSVEVRYCYMLDSGGRVYCVNRRRGHPPESQVIERGDGYEVSGRVLDGLRRILLAVSAHLPEGSVDRDAIEKAGE